MRKIILPMFLGVEVVSYVATVGEAADLITVFLKSEKAALARANVALGRRG